MAETEHEITLQIEKTGDGMHGRRIVHEGTVWYEKKATRTNFFLRHHFSLRNAISGRVLAEYRNKAVVLHRVDHTLKATYAKLFHSRKHQQYRFEGADGNEYQLEGHAFTNKVDMFLIDKPDKKVCTFLATLWMRHGFLFTGDKRGELTLHEPETLVDASGDTLKPSALLDDLLVHCLAYTDVLKAKGDAAPVSVSSDDSE